MADPRITQILEALEMVQEAAVAQRGLDFNLTVAEWARFHLALAAARSLQAASQAAQQNDYRYKLPMGWNAAVAMARGAELFDRIDIQPAILVMIDDMLAAAPQQPAQQAVRMLTSDELYAALPTPRTPGEYIGTQNVAFTWDAWQAYVGAVERKFCEVNGIELSPAAKEGEKKQ